MKKRQQLKKDRQQRGREKEGEASRTEELAGRTGWEWQFDCWGARQGSARVSAGLVLDSGNLHAPFPCDALQVVGWTVCGHLQLWDVLSASASCVVYFSGLFSRQPTWLVATGRVSLRDRVFVKKSYSFLMFVEFFFFYISGSARSLSVPAHLFLCHARTFRVASTSSVSSALQNQILNKSGRTQWSYVTEEGRRAFVPSCRKLWVVLQQEEFTNGPHGQLCCSFSVHSLNVIDRL